MFSIKLVEYLMKEKVICVCIAKTNKREITLQRPSSDVVTKDVDSINEKCLEYNPSREHKGGYW